MAAKNTKTTVAVVASVVVVAAVAVIGFRRVDSPRRAQAEGRQEIDQHLAAPVDMTMSYTTPASRLDQITQFPAWKAVPRGFQTFDNVPFKIGGMICLWGGGNAKAGLVFPEQLEGIEVKQKFETLYVYHAAFYGAPAGTTVYSVVFRYQDGSAATNQICYGTDVLDWYSPRTSGNIGPTGPRSRLAWHGQAESGQPLRFCITAVENPQPSMEVETIDLYSCKHQPAACVMAMTPGKAGLMK